MATIGDVAREAQVSRSTVSSVLTGRKFVAPATRARIESAIEKLGYTVNSGARALATSRTMVIGIVAQLHGLEFSPALASFVFALTNAARAAGYDALMITEADASEAIRRMAQTRRVDGLVLLSVLDNDPRIEALKRHEIPAVLLGTPRDSHGVDAVDLDFAAAARGLLDLLYANGHREVLFARWSQAMFRAGHGFVHRFNDAALAHAHELGMTLHPFHCPDTPEQVAEVLEKRLRQHGEATALMIHDDAATVLLPQALYKIGLGVPRDLSVVSLHSTELGRALALPYTSVESDAQRVADEAVAILLQRMAAPMDGTAPIVNELLPPRITLRSSIRTLGADTSSAR